MSAVDRESGSPIGSSPQSGCLIWQTQSEWRITAGGLETTLGSGSSLEKVAAATRDLVDHSELQENRCVIALPSTECFFADFPASDVSDVKDRSAMAYELERFFPLDAEAMVLDYSFDRSNNRFAAVGIETERHRDLIDQLESRDLDVVSVLPSAFLIARGVVQWRGHDGRFQLIICRGDVYESLLVDGSGVWSWKVLAGEEPLRRHLSLATDEIELVVVGAHDQWRIDPPASVELCDQTSGQLAVSGADETLNGHWGRWLELRRGDLAPSDPLRAVAKPLRWLALAASFCFLTVGLAALHRSQRISTEIAEVKEQQRLVFREAFPGRRVPIMLVRTVRSEHRKTLGSRGKGDSIKLPVPATDVLRRLYAGLETAREEARFRLLDITITDGECLTTVRARDAVHIGTIAKSLEAVGFRVQPPGSEQIPASKDEPIETYQSTISAIWADDVARGDVES